MKKIVVPTDFSDVAQNALVYAFELAKTFEAEIFLVHTYTLPIVEHQFAPQNYQVLFDSLEWTNFELFKQEMPAIHALAETHKAGHIRITPVVMDGDLLYNLKEFIANEKADFVVMGTSGTSGWKEYFLGSNTAEAITNLNVPVMSIPVTARYDGINTLGFTTRFREKDKAALDQVIAIAKGLQAQVHCLYVETKDTDNTPATYEDWKDHYRHDPVLFHIIPNENIEDTITDFIMSESIDVMAMLTYKRNFFAQLFLESVTEKMVNHASIPILALHE
ncbi:universal stress protein [Flavobacterium sp. N1719]|uniref:universal stress protein n=1 Tax=Flavobacterium sp. N1719 TaxID=2885633 RepID=UPI002221C9B8|nr:universal stress protein [Flavobacterium sp. N1719]